MMMCIALCLLVVSSGAMAVAGPPTFEQPYRLSAGEQWIDVDTGHAAPWVIDWDGDGVDDLLVGQFGAGHLRIYRNVGTNDAPKFGQDFALFQTRHGLGSIPSG